MIGTKERRARIREQLIKGPEVSNRQIAVMLGVDHKTVGAQRVLLEQSGEIPRVDAVTDTLGRVQPRRAKTKK